MPPEAAADFLLTVIMLMAVLAMLLLVIPMSLRTMLVYNVIRLRIQAVRKLCSEPVGSSYRCLLIGVLDRFVKNDQDKGMGLLATILIRRPFLSEVAALSSFKDDKDKLEAESITIEFYKYYIRYLWVTSPILAAFVYSRLPKPKHNSLLAALRLCYSMDDSWKGL